MSLSFVSKAVLTTTSDGYEEKPIEGKEESDTGISGSRTNAKPLFEQLRANKEQEEQEREEFQKSIMRGTLALDEEDCAHLDAVQKQKHEQAKQIQQQTQSELEAFRAAQAVNRMEQGAIPDDYDDDQDDKGNKEPAKQQNNKPAAAGVGAATNNKKSNLFPKIVVKKKRRISDKKEGAAAEAKKPKQNATDETAKSKPKEEETKSAMAGLLAGYGSDSDSD